MKSNQDPKEIIKDAVTGVVAGAAIKTFIYLIAKALGEQYSAEDESKLDELKILYKTHLHLEDAPEFWALDENKRPCYTYVPHRQYEAHANRAKKKKHGVKNYNYYSSVIIDICVSYLESRKNRYVGKGKPGDLVELFAMEWLGWALDDLPQLGYGKTSIEQLNNRLTYITLVEEHPNLFKQGNLERDIEKFDVIIMIKKQLNSCIQKAKEEQGRITSQRHFDTIQQNTSGLLFEALKVVYYARSLPAHTLPFVIEDYIQPSLDLEHAKLAKTLIPKIKATHTGAMLEATLVFAGVETFDLKTQTYVGDVLSIYFDSDFKARPDIEWDDDLSDLPPWVEQGEKINQLKVIQKLCERVLQFAAIKKLVESAYSLAGLSGDLWTYGDRQGKQSVVALLYLFNTELEKLKASFESFENYHRNLISKYNKIAKKNYNTVENCNFTKVKNAIKKLQELCNLLRTTSNEISEQLVTFPEDAEKLANKKKHEFYRDVHSLLRKFCPDRADLFTYDGELANEEKIVDKKHKKGKKQVIQTNKLEHFSFKLASTETGYVSYSKAAFKGFIARNPSANDIKNFLRPWYLGDNYDVWSKGFFTRNKKLFEAYKSFLDDNLKGAIVAENTENVDRAYKAVQSLINKLKANIKQEKPEWRFKYYIVPVTFGYPFNKKSARFAQLLIDELTDKSVGLQRYVEEVKAIIKRGNEAEEKNSGSTDVPRDKKSIRNEIERASTNLKLYQAKKSNKAVTPVAEEIQDCTEIVIDNATQNVSANKENVFLTWYTKFNSILESWQDMNFSYELSIFDSQELANKVFQECLAYRRSLKSDAIFIESCQDILNSLNLLLEVNEDLIKGKSRSQFNLITQLIKTLISPLENDEYLVSQEAFLILCKNTFSENILSVSGAYNVHGLMKANMNKPIVGGVPHPSASAYKHA